MPNISDRKYSQESDIPSDILLKSEEYESDGCQKNEAIHANPESCLTVSNKQIQFSEAIWKINYIGVGRFSSVYRCVLKELGFLFAIK